MAKKHIPTTKPVVAASAQTTTPSTPSKAPTAKVKAPAVKAKVATPVTGETKSKSDGPSKFKSRDTFTIQPGQAPRRMRVAEYQDYTLSINDRPDRRLTDEELCRDWQTQFPSAVVFTPFHVAGVRRDYNKGTHSRAFTGSHTSQPYRVGANGKEKFVPVRTVKAKADAPTAQPVAATPAIAKAAKAMATKVRVARQTSARRAS